jgi:hypothetical protein
MAQATGRQRRDSSRPVGNSRTRRGSNPSRVPSQAMVPCWVSSTQADDWPWVTARTSHTCLLPQKLTVMAKPMAQHSQPMRLPGRRARITAPTVAKAKNGTQVARPEVNSWDISASLPSMNAIPSTSTRTTSSHRPQATQDADCGPMRSRLGPCTALVSEGCPVLRSMGCSIRSSCSGEEHWP